VIIVGFIFRGDRQIGEIKQTQVYLCQGMNHIEMCYNFLH